MSAREADSYNIILHGMYWFLRLRESLMWRYVKAFIILRAMPDPIKNIQRHPNISFNYLVILKNKYKFILYDDRSSLGSTEWFNM